MHLHTTATFCMSLPGMWGTRRSEPRSPVCPILRAPVPGTHFGQGIGSTAFRAVTLSLPLLCLSPEMVKADGGPPESSSDGGFFLLWNCSGGYPLVSLMIVKVR